MPSLKLSLLAAAATVLSTAQATNYTVDPSSVSLTLRKSWCASEISACPLICDQTAPYTTKVNTCDSNTLEYACICGDGLEPNITEYSLTIPYFECQEWGNQCVTACGTNNNTCSSSCRQDHPCGALDPIPANTTAKASASASATGSSATMVYGAFGSSSTGSTKKSFAAHVVDASRVMGIVATLGGLTAGISLLL